MCVYLLQNIQVKNTGGDEYKRWEEGINRALEDMEKKR